MSVGDIELETWNLLWAVGRSARYHSRRIAFYDRWRNLTAGVGVIFGSAAAVDLLKDGGHELAVIAAFIVTIVSTVDLVVNTADKTWLHRDLRKRFLLLEAAIKCHPRPAETDVLAWCKERLTIESDEPPIYVALDLLCENEMTRAHGMPQKAFLSWWATRTANVWLWENLGSDGKKK